ncbi:MAG: sulfotransferase family 2 domain-containing protein [Planctomycetia bacterium]
MGRSCARGGVHLVVCERHRLIYRPLQKCASTTVINFIGDLAGHADRREGRDFLPFAAAVEATPGQGGTYAVKVPAASIAAFVERYAGYLWFSVIREPYGRLKSNYFNKLNRYARRCEPTVYLRAYLRLAAAGRAFWRQGHEARRTASMQARISFPQFVAGLQRYGIDWDWHYAAQADLLRTDVIPYHRLVRMEELAAGLREVVADAGAASAAAPALEALPRLNRSSAGAAADADLWTDATRRIAAGLYHRDFATLGYAA